MDVTRVGTRPVHWNVYVGSVLFVGTPVGVTHIRTPSVRLTMDTGSGLFVETPGGRLSV